MHGGRIKVKELVNERGSVSAQRRSGVAQSRAHQCLTNDDHQHRTQDPEDHRGINELAGEPSER
jgi:hypothetical protein